MSQQEIFKAPIVASFEQLYRVYKVEKERAEPEYRIENVRFIHDPEWRERWFSVQHSGDVTRAVLNAVTMPVKATWVPLEDAAFWIGFWYATPQKRSNSLPPRIRLHRVTAP